MELIDGETLAAKLARDGPLSIEGATEIARQLAAGLDAAHTAGVIHRDFKPGNVMLASGRAVVTDFGLAIPIPPGGQDVQLATTSMLLGTPGYVAPEQWAGQPASTASDIYSFGVVLHEMIAGCHPNSRGVEKAEIPSEWSLVIQKCLELDHTARWKSAKDAVAALKPGLVSRRKVLVIAVGLGGLSLGGYGLLSYREKVLLPPGAKVLIIPLDNKTNDQALSAWTEALARQLDLSRQVQPGSELAADVSPANLRESAMRRGIPLVAFFSAAPIAGDISLSLRLELLGQDVNFPARVWRRSWHAANRQDMMHLAGVAGEWIRQTAGESDAEIRERSRAPEVLTSASWEALRVFHAAERARRNGELDKSLALYQEAEQIDPKFALSAAKVGDVFMEVGRVDESLQAQARSVNLLKSKAVSTREALQVRIDHAIDGWSYADGAKAAELYRSLYPDEPTGHFFAAEYQFLSGRFEQAVALYRMADEKSPQTVYIFDKLHWTLLALRKFREADEVLEQNRTSTQLPWVKRMRGISAFVQGDFEYARRVFLELATLTGSGNVTVSIWGLLHLAQLEAELRNFDAAQSTFEKLLDYCRRMNRPGQEAYVCLHLAELMLGKGRIGQAVEFAEKSTIGGGRVSSLRAAAFLVRIKQGHRKLRKSVDSAQEVFPRISANQLLLDGETALADFAPQLAVNLFRKAQQISPVYSFPSGLLRGLRAAGELAEWRDLTDKLRSQSALYFRFALTYPPGGLANLG